MDQQKALPKHVAIVMAGNGRWAKRQFMRRVAGHKVGVDAVRLAVKFCIKNKIEILTLFALSVENFLHRPKTEVRFILSLFSDFLIKETKVLHEKNVRLRVIGDLSVFSKTLQDLITNAEQLTAENTGLQLVVAANYSGRWDLFQAAKAMAKDMVNQSLDVDTLTEADLQQHICLSDLPEPDLLIRTSGEKRISNFLLWQLAYTELCFIDELWPDFNEDAFQRAIDAYQHRQRRFGFTGEQITKGECFA